MPGTYTHSLEMTAARDVAVAALRSPGCEDNSGNVPPQTAWCLVAALRLERKRTAPHYSTDLGLAHPGYALSPLCGSDRTDGGHGSSPMGGGRANWVHMSISSIERRKPWWAMFTANSTRS
jgi:hypothetical protein